MNSVLFKSRIRRETKQKGKHFKTKQSTFWATKSFSVIGGQNESDDIQTAQPLPSPRTTMNSSATTVCTLTPAGRGAVAVVEVRGNGAIELVGSRFHSASGWRLEEIPVGRIAFGLWKADQRQGEEVVVTRHANRLEIHCHGGAAASRAIVQSMVEAGATDVDQATWQTMDSPDGLVAEAARHLANAATERAALVLLDQYQGALSRELLAVMDSLNSGDLQTATETLQQLAERWPLGKRLTEPARVVITGPPNVGKSSLLNALVGFERAIVFDMPGTTRDVVTACTAIDGWAVEFLDTAGLRQAAKGIESADIERAGMQLARHELTQADVVLLVGDATSWLDGQTPAGDFAEWYNDHPLIAVASKCDLLSDDQRQTLDSRNPELVLTSAVTDGGVEPLLQAIAAKVAPGGLPVGTAVPFSSQQEKAIRRTIDSISAGDAEGARMLMESLLELEGFA